MNTEHNIPNVSTEGPDHDHESSNNETEELLQTLAKQKNWDGRMLCNYQGFWVPMQNFRGIFFCRKNFKARETDIILASMPKGGTTWLKALTFSIVNRHLYRTNQQSPLLTSNPHDLVPFLEFRIYREHENPSLEHIPSPRTFCTHLSYGILPDSVPKSGCKIIYICRNPLDQFVSQRHFLLTNRLQPDEEPLSLDEAFEMYCNGFHQFGPYWDQMLEYWNASLEKPDRVLFLKYEELKEDIVSNVKKIAEFVGMPFSEEEEKEGRIEEISRLCSFENLKNLGVNKEGKLAGIILNSSFYRKGEVGDWKNYLNSSMADRLDQILKEKLSGSGLTFKSYLKC